MRDYLNTQAPTHFLFPIDGDHLNERDGTVENGCLTFTATVCARPGCKIRIGDVPATEQDGVYAATVCIPEGESTLHAENLTDGTSCCAKLRFSTRMTGKYRISSDDNILFLADITKNKDTYTSIFDNPYLAVYKKAHDLYGAKVHLNLFYAFDRTAARLFADERPDFNLSMVTDQFKAEWEANADWLKLSFHSFAEYPDKPYVNATAEKITADFEAVRREVLRFAGEKTFCHTATTVHWGSANAECTAALRDLGHRVLAGYFTLNKDGTPGVSYYAPAPLVEHIYTRDFWTDTQMGMHFARIDRVTNIGTLEEVMADVKEVVADPHRGGFVSIMIHEQYFYKDYKNHRPDFEARVLEPTKYLFENGYRGTFLSELL